MITPEQLANGTEEGEQRAVIQWAALNLSTYPQLKWLFHIPNGGMYGNTKEDRQIRGARMRAAGVKKGVFDLMLPYPVGQWHGLFIEMKKKGGKLSPEQVEFGNFIWNCNYFCVDCYTYIEAKEVIVNYLNNKL